MILNDVEYTTFKMFVTRITNYLFVISFQLMFYETLRYRLARAFRGFPIQHWITKEKGLDVRLNPVTHDNIIWTPVGDSSQF